ncbi:MAG: transcription-repair coupling factor, partial [Panacagrimonas sp.]
MSEQLLSQNIDAGSAAPEAALALHTVEHALSSRVPILAVAGNEQQAYRIENALRFFASNRLPVLHLPDSETLPYDPFSPHQELLSDRMAALASLPGLQRGIVLITADALIQKLPPRSFLDARSLLLKAGQTLESSAFRERLVAAGYASVGEVQTQGEFAVRGAIIDLFPMGSDAAYRIDLFDDEIESIRTFDPETQRSTDKVEQVRLLPAREFPTDKAGIELFRRRYREYFPGDPARSRIYAEVSRGFMPAGIEAWLPLFFSQTARLLDYLPPATQVLPLADLAGALNADWTQIEDRFERLRGDIERPLMRPTDLFTPPAEALEALQLLAAVAVELKALPAPKTADNVRSFLATSTQRVLFVAESAGRREAMLDWLKPLGILPRVHEHWSEFEADRNKYGITLGPLQEGLIVPDTALARFHWRAAAEDLCLGDQR